MPGNARLLPNACFVVDQISRWCPWLCRFSLILGCSELFFVDPGVKVDGRYYRDMQLKQQMLPVMRRIAGDVFVFQQDSAPAHRACETVQLLQQQTPGFVSPDLWPPNSPNLNPVDYRIWGLIQERVYKTAVPDVSQLKQRLINTWSGTSFRVPAVANRLFSEPPKAFRRKHSAFAYT